MPRYLIPFLIAFLLLIPTIAYADGPPVEIVSHNPALTGAGCLFVAPFQRQGGSVGNGHLMIVNDWGAVVWSQAISDSRNATDFKLQPNGLLTYFDRSRGLYVALDSDYNEVGTYDAIGYSERIDQHELILPDDHRALYMIYEQRQMDLSAYGGYTDALVIGTTIQEQTDGAVSFEWSTWDHFLITDTLADLTGARVDLFHGNSVDYTPTGDIIISHRGNDEVTLVDYDTGAIIWRLGGPRNQFALISDTVWFSGQHDARILPNGNLTLFDNGGHGQDEPGPSRAIEYEIDTQAMEARRVWSYQDGTYGWFMGNVQRLPNGNTLIGWGGANADNAGPFDLALTEVTPGGEVVLQMAFAQTNTVSYRAFRFPWAGCGGRQYWPMVGND